MGEEAAADEGLEPIPPLKEPAPSACPGRPLQNVEFACILSMSKCWKMKSMGQWSSSSAIIPSHRDGRLKNGWIVVIFLFQILAP